MDIVKYQDQEYTSTTTPSQFNDVYEISQDGFLWFRECDHKMKQPAQGPFNSSSLVKENCRWRVMTEFTGRFSFSNEERDFLAIVTKGRVENII